MIVFNVERQMSASDEQRCNILSIRIHWTELSGTPSSNTLSQLLKAVHGIHRRKKRISFELNYWQWCAIKVALKCTKSVAKVRHDRRRRAKMLGFHWKLVSSNRISSKTRVFCLFIDSYPLECCFQLAQLDLTNIADKEGVVRAAEYSSQCHG